MHVATCFALSRAYDVVFGLSTLISNRILFHNLCEIEYPASGTLENDLRRRYADVPFPLATKEIGDACTQATTEGAEKALIYGIIKIYHVRNYKS